MRYSTTSSASGISPVLIVLWLAVVIISIAGTWRMYQKANQPGWAAIIPIYNIVVLLRIVGRPLWWIVLLLIPLVNIVALIIIAIDLAKAFGKSGAFAAGLILLAPIFYCILGFGPARYRGTVA